MYPVKAPFLLRWLYPSLIWHKSRSEKSIYLTFDDGPIPEVTDFVLETLRKYNAKATFFCVGENIQKHPHVFENVKKEGHSIGNHTFNHLNGWVTKNVNYLDNFNLCQQLTDTHLFRPPYGRIKKQQIKDLQNLPLKTNKNLEIMMWEILSGDFDPNTSPQQCYLNVIKNVKNGSIVIFHDSIKTFEKLKYALPKVLKHFSERGYQFKSL